MADVFAKDVVRARLGFGVLARTQGVDAQSRRREHEGHVEVEGRAWVHAFNLGISLAAAVPAMLSPLGGFGRLTTAARMAAACVAKLLGWLSSRPAAEVGYSRVVLPAAAVSHGADVLLPSPVDFAAVGVIVPPAAPSLLCAASRRHCCRRRLRNR